MTDSKLLEVLDFYQSHLSKKYTRQKAFYEKKPANKREALNHVLWMISETQIFISEGRREKAMRWLGFIQGVLWSNGEFTLDQLKNHSKPDMVG